jgi:hypothetical protein
MNAKMTIARVCVVLVGSLCVGRLLPGETARGSSATSAPAASSLAGLDAAVAELADARWEVRRAAGFRLIDAGEASLPALHRAYWDTRSHEVRLRIRELAEAVFSDSRLPDKGAFLGIRQRPRLRQIDPRVPAGTSWVEVLQVFRDTAADRAGLRAGDLIVRCGGQSLPEDPTGQSFGAIVSRHRPGTEVTFDILRGTGDPIALKVRLGRRPMAVLAEADPEAYAAVRSAFEEWWQDRFLSPTSRPAAGRRSTTRPAGVARPRR